MEMNSLTHGNVYKKLIKFAVPFLLAQLLQSLYGATDLLMVGRFGTIEDVSGVTVGSQVLLLFTLGIIGLTMGITISLGQYLGAKDYKGLAETIGVSIIIFAVIGLLLSGILLFAKGTIVTLMNTPPEAVENTKDYLFYCALGAFFMTGYNVICGVMRGLGDSKSPLYFVAVACVINIALDYILIKYFDMGAAGAAIATSVAQAVSFVFSILYLYKKGLGFSFTKKEIRFYKNQFLHIFKIGIPIAVQDVLVSMSFLLIIAIINPLGIIASASVGIVEKLTEFLFLVPIALNAAVSAMVAQNYGAGQYERTKQCLWASIWMTGGYGLLIAVYCQFLGHTLTGLFTIEPEVMKMAATYLQSYSWDIFLAGILFCLGGYFNGYGRTVFNMCQNLISALLVRVPLAFLLRQAVVGTSLFAIGWASPISTVVSLVICVFYFRRMKVGQENEIDDTAGRHPQALEEEKETP